MSEAAVPITLEPGSPEWLREMTASKVPAVLGLSPWTSRFTLWYEMAGGVAHQQPTTQMERGHYLEDAVARWVADQYGLDLVAGGCWRNRARPWQVASPDRLALRWANTYEHRPLSSGICVCGETHAKAVVEVKTAADWERWGPDGSDDIPPYYRAQVVWQCDTLGVDTGYVGVLLPRLELRGYVIHPADGEVEFIREECRDFLDSLAAQEPPDVDRWGSTYSTLRELHPDIEQREVDLEPALARAYARALVGLRAAEDEYNLRRSQVAQVMGSARKARYGGVVLANRQPGPTGVPYVNPGSKHRLAAVAQEEDDDGE